MGLTIFTPSYNRAYIIGNLYNSLCAQKCKDFEWVVIDDGSFDGTEELIKGFMNEGIIKIRYYFQKNAGKSMAHNYGVELAEESLFTCVDSDDYLTDDAVEQILKRWEIVKDIAVGIVAKRKTKKNKDITKTRLSDGDLINLREVYGKKALVGDTFLIFKTNIIQKIKFPHFEQEFFVPEDYIYDKIGMIGKLCFLDQSLYVCEYLSDGYTNNMNKLIARNPKGYRAFVEQRIDLESSVYKKFLNYIRYEGITFVIGKGFFRNKDRLLSLIALAPGFIMYLRRYKAYRKE